MPADANTTPGLVAIERLPSKWQTVVRGLYGCRLGDSNRLLSGLHPSAGPLRARHRSTACGSRALRRNRGHRPSGRARRGRERQGQRCAVPPPRAEGGARGCSWAPLPDRRRQAGSALPRGHKLGDVSARADHGCRAEEVASLTISDVAHDCAGLSVRSGKTSNAKRYVPLIAPGRAVLRERARKAAQGGEQRVFPEWPVRTSTGKSSALPAALTRFDEKRVPGGRRSGHAPPISRRSADSTAP